MCDTHVSSVSRGQLVTGCILAQWEMGLWLVCWYAMNYNFMLINEAVVVQFRKLQFHAMSHVCAWVIRLLTPPPPTWKTIICTFMTKLIAHHHCILSSFLSPSLSFFFLPPPFPLSLAAAGFFILSGFWDKKQAAPLFPSPHQYHTWVAPACFYGAFNNLLCCSIPPSLYPLSPLIPPQ